MEGGQSTSFLLLLATRRPVLYSSLILFTLIYVPGAGGGPVHLLPAAAGHQPHLQRHAPLLLPTGHHRLHHQVNHVLRAGNSFALSYSSEGSPALAVFRHH
jgi:hypothetical protein